MIIVKSKDLNYIPASHEDQQNPEVWKKILFRKEDLAGDGVRMINWAKLPKGNSFKAHYHENMDEIYIILNGKTIVKVAGEEAELEKGDAVLIPTKLIHKMTNVCNEDVIYIVVGISRGRDGKTVIVE